MFHILWANLIIGLLKSTNKSLRFELPENGFFSRFMTKIQRNNQFKGSISVRRHCFTLFTSIIIDIGDLYPKLFQGGPENLVTFTFSSNLWNTPWKSFPDRTPNRKRVYFSEAFSLIFARKLQINPKKKYLTKNWLQTILSSTKKQSNMRYRTIRKLFMLANGLVLTTGAVLVESEFKLTE